MLFTEPQMTSFLQSIQHKTFANEIRWDYEGNRYYTALLPNIVITLEVPGHHNNDPILRVSVIENRSDVIGKLEMNPDHAMYNLVRQMYDHIQRRRQEARYSEIMAVLNNPGMIDPRPAQQTGPTPVQQKEVMQKMAGKWNLNFSTGQEVATISEDGTYSVEGRPQNPVFVLTVIACNDLLSKVEIAKDYLDGRRKHIEVLTITPDQMIGVAKHDQHRLVYTRIPRS